MDRTDQPPEPTGLARVTALVLSVLGPLLLFGALAQWLANANTEGDQQADENAGLVFNGQVLEIDQPVDNPQA